MNTIHPTLLIMLMTRKTIVKRLNQNYTGEGLRLLLEVTFQGNLQFYQQHNEGFKFNFLGLRSENSFHTNTENILTKNGVLKLVILI